MDVTKCVRCEHEIDTSMDGLTLENRVPCPQCGSTSRNCSVSLRDEVVLGSLLKTKHFAGGLSRTKGLKAETIDGDKLGTDRPYHVKISQLVDRENDRYVKKVVDPRTGEVIRDVDHPLSEHYGRGSAKPRKPGGPGEP